MIRKRRIWFAVASLVLIHVVVLGAAFFAPYDPAEQFRSWPFAPPMRLHFIDAQGKFHLRPSVCPWVSSETGVGPSSYLEDCSSAQPIRFFLRDRPRQENANQQGTRRLFGVAAPAHLFLLGTDDYGRDQLSRLLYGGQSSLFAGLLATGLSLGVGLLLGSVAGYFASWVDDTIMRGAEIFMALPWIYLLFAVRAFLPLQIGSRQSFFLVVGVIGLAAWARPARLVRGVILSAKEREFVLAARGFGASNAYILRRHLLPEASSVILTQAAVLIPQCILAEVTLSFLGLGVGEPVSSWGNMLAGLQKYYVVESYWWMFLPGIILVPIFLLYYRLADALLARIKAPGYHTMNANEVASRRKFPVAI